MKRGLTGSFVSLGLVALLVGCQNTASAPTNGTADNPNSNAASSTPMQAQALSTFPKYLKIGGTYQIKLGWTPISPVVTLDGRPLPITGIAGNIVSVQVPNPIIYTLGTEIVRLGVAWGGPRTLSVSDGAHWASKASFVLGDDHQTGNVRVLFLTAPGVTKAALDALLATTGLFSKPTSNFFPLGGPGNCAGAIAEGYFDGAGTFEQALEQLDALAAANPGTLMGVNPQTVDGTGTEPYDANATPMTGRDELNAAAHKRGRNGAGTMIAVLDTGIGRSTFPVASQFGTRLLAGRQFTPAAQGNAVLAANTYDDFMAGGVLVGHGTQVASLAASSGFGVAPSALVLPVKVCDQSGKCRRSDVIRGVCWAAAQAQNTVKLSHLVLNFSLGGDTGDLPNDILKRILVNLVKDYRVLVAASSGNDWDNYVRDRNSGIPNYEPRNYPASYDLDGLLGVGAVQKLSNPMGGILYRTSLYADRGKLIDLLAPGTLVRALNPSGQLQSNNVGTSFAAPHVAGALALWRQAEPTMTARDVQVSVLKFVKPDTSLLKPPAEEYDHYRLQAMLDLTKGP